MIDKDSSNLPDKSSWRFFNCNWLKEKKTQNTNHMITSQTGDPQFLVTTTAGIKLPETHAWHRDTLGGG